MLRNEVGEYAVAARERKRSRSRAGVTGIGERVIEREQQHADEEKPDELREHDRAARQQRYRRRTRAIGTEITLDQVLIGAVRAHRQEAAADQSRPERVSLRVVESEVEHRVLAVLLRESI